jgi:hypothetical protein
LELILIENALFLGKETDFEDLTLIDWRSNYFSNLNLEDMVHLPQGGGRGRKLENGVLDRMVLAM